MNISIIRHRKTGEAIDGRLYVDGQRLCDTAENVIGALTAGTYKVVRHYCKQYNRYVPAILNPSDSSECLESFCKACPKITGVTNNTTMPLVCHQLKMGNGIYKREDGSIILGTYICPGCLKLPRDPYETLSERIRKLDGRGTEITLTIREEYAKRSKSHFNL